MTNKILWIASALLLVRPDTGLTQTGPPPTDIYLVEVTPSESGLRYQTLVMARGGKLYQATLESQSGAWREIADWTAQNIRNITRLAVSPSGKRLAFVADASLR